MNPAWLQAASALLLTALFVGVLDTPARRWGWIDYPNATRKRHRDAVPLTGGAAMCLAFVLVVLFSTPLPVAWPLVIAMAAVTLAGVWDDRHDVGALIRMVVQAMAVLVLCLATDTRLETLGALVGPTPIHIPQMLQLPFTVFAVVGVINAMNMIDGVDGLAGGLSLVALVALVVLAQASGQTATAGVLLTLAGGVVGFLLFNLRHPWRDHAKAFMGDAGSTLLGLALGWHLVALSQPGATAVALPPALALWLVAIPLIDTVRLMISRALGGRSPLAADHNHLHHVLRDRGWSDVHITVALVLLGAVVAAGAIAMWRAGVRESTLFYGFLGSFAAVTLAIAVFGRARNS